MAFDIAAQIKRTKAKRPSHPFIGSGQHEMTVLQFRQSESKDDGVIYAVDFVIDKSTADDHKAGSIRSQIFKVERRPKFSTMDSDADRLVDLIGKLVCADSLEKAQEAAGKILSEPGLKAQIARGMRVSAFGKPPKKTSTGSDFVDVNYTSVVQTREAIAVRRREVDATHPIGVEIPADEPATPPASSGSGLLDGL